MVNILRRFELFTNGLNEHYQSLGCQGVDLEIGLRNDRRFNAEASIFDGKDIIGISLGLFFVMRNVLTCFARNGIFTSVLFTGRFSICRSQRESITDFDISREVIGNHAFPDDGISEEDKAVRDFILMIVVNWILHHELAHIWNGHLGLAASTRQSLSISDGGGPIHQNVDWRMVALEWDADSRANHAVLMEFAGLGGSREAFAIPHMHHEQNWSLNVMFVIMAIQIAMTCMSFVNWRSRPDLIGLTHPSPHLRRIMCLNGIRNTLSSVEGMNVWEIKRVTQLATTATYLGMSSVLDASDSELAKVFDSVSNGGEIMQHLEHAWTEIHPLLEPFKRGLENHPPYGIIN